MFVAMPILAQNYSSSKRVKDAHMFSTFVNSRTRVCLMEVAVLHYLTQTPNQKQPITERIGWSTRQRGYFAFFALSKPKTCVAFESTKMAGR